MTNASIYAAFQRMWQHITIALDNKSTVGHKHDLTDIVDFQAKTTVKKTVILDSDNVTTIDFNEIVPDVDKLDVYYNGILLTSVVHYAATNTKIDINFSV